MAGHAQLKFVMTECSKTQIHLTRPISFRPNIKTDNAVYSASYLSAHLTTEGALLALDTRPSPFLYSLRKFWGKLETGRVTCNHSFNVMKYCKNPKNSDSQKKEIAVIIPKLEQYRFA